MKAIADIGGGSGCWPSDQGSWYYSSSKQRSKENLFYPVNLPPREEPSTCRGSYSSYSSKPFSSSAFNSSNSSAFPGSSSSSSSCSSSSSASRSLFGASDPRESHRLAREEFRSQRLGDCSRWNFDFHKEKPVAGRYDWRKVGSSGKTEDSHSYRSGSKSPKLFSSESKLLILVYFFLKKVSLKT